MQEVVQSVDRSLSILEVLSDYEDGLGITEISEKVNLHKSTVHRLLATLIYKGYVKQEYKANKYKLTLKLFQLGNKKIQKMDLVTVARPYLKELVEKTNEVAHLVVTEDTEIIYVEKEESQNTIRTHSTIGDRRPLYCTAVGKSILSYMEDDKIEEIWNKSNVQKLTEYTITDFNEFKKYLNKVRKNGYAVDEQENEVGVRCVGASIFNYKGEVCGAISISGSIITFTEEKLEDFSKLIIEYTHKISKELGYRG
ncbi:IclR family transcriptional regulator [Clostridium sp. Marseille-Q2269]|uniref:IclR family transcriptional regulator n=1 Tax=Clostridium sp. Marseille-Q2269 TaxID=2942205 RepID=UPI0020744176|nr:IclR family transcriptional regulator [Clostridium sp. Marseille-Q2269]